MFDNETIEQNNEIQEDTTPIENASSDETIQEGVNTQVENTEVTTEEQTQMQPFLNVKYNKEDVALSQEEAIMLSQKGMNYDKLQQKYEELNNNPGLQYLNNLAQKSGMKVDELVNFFRERDEQAQLDELIQQNIPEDYAREMLESRKFREEQTKLMEETRREKMYYEQDMELSKDTTRSKFYNEWKDEVKNAAKRYGVDLQTAFSVMLYERLPDILNNMSKSTEQETIKKINQNANTSPGALGQATDLKKANAWDMSDEEFKVMQEKARRGELRQF